MTRILLLIFGFLISHAAFAQTKNSTEAAKPPSVAAPMPIFLWNTNDFFGPCRGECRLSFYGGPEIISDMTRIFLLQRPLPIWDWRAGGSGLAATAVSRRLLTWRGVAEVAPEFGAAKRIGDLTAGELWAALLFRWTAFPWNNYLRTTIGVSEGITYATKIDKEEWQFNKRRGSNFLNFFSPELTFAPPGDSDFEVLLRLQIGRAHV